MLRDMARWMSVVLALGLAGCGKGGESGTAPPPPKMDTPRATADAVAQAFKARSGKLAAALMPSDDQLKQAFGCPANELVTRLTGKRASAAKDFEKVPADMGVAVGEFDKQGTVEKLYKAGETYEGCKVKAPVTVHKSRLELAITKDGKVDYDGETWTFLKLAGDDKWYYVP
jgi:hypothetical protein